MSEESIEGAALVAAHKEITRKLRVLTIVFPITVMTIIVWNLSSLVSTVQAVDTGEVASELAHRANSLWPDVEREFAEIATGVEPALAEAFVQESEVMTPQLEKRLEADLQALARAAEGDFRAAVDASLDELQERQRAILVHEIPALADDQAAQDEVLAAVRAALSAWAVNQLNTTFNEHLDVMQDLQATLQKSYTAPEGDDADPESALATWIELMNERVAGDSVIVPEPGKKKPKGKAAARVAAAPGGAP